KGRRRFNYDVYDRCLGLALSECVGDTSALQIYCDLTFYPRTIADVGKTALLDEALLPSNTLNPDADILAWRSIQKILQKDDADLASSETSLEVKELYKRYVSASQRVLTKVKESLVAVKNVEQPQLHHPVYLLRQWVNLPLSVADGRESLSKLVDREKKCYSRLSLHSDGITIPWKLRRLLLGSILRATPLFSTDHDLAFCNHVEELEKSEDGSPDSFLAGVVALARSSGCSSVEAFLGISPSKPVRELQYASGSFYPDYRKRKRPGVPSLVKRRRQVADGDVSKGPVPSTTDGISASDKGEREARSTPVTPASRSMKKPVRCYRCNKIGHYAYQCPTRNSSKSLDSVSLPVDRDDSSVELKPRTAVSLQINHSLLTSRVEVLSEKHQGSSETVKVALDTMSSTNIVSQALVARLGLLIRDDPTELSSLGTRGVPGKGTVLRISVKGKGVVTLYCLVLEEGNLERSCQCELLVGYRDLKRLGVSILVPSPAPVLPAHSLEDQIEVAKDYLRSVVGKWFPLEGAPAYHGRLRPVKKTDSLDTKEQCWIYEVDWDECKDVKSSSSAVYDYSVGLIAGLPPHARTQFRDEIKNFCDKKWWFTQLQPHHKVIRPPAVTFPVIQGAYKSTPCRPCSDLRPTNRLLPKASYCGRPVGDIIDMVRCRYRSHHDFLFLDLSKAFLRLHLGGDKVLEIKSDGGVYYSDRVLFGYKHGPVSLSGHVTLLLNATFSALTGRRIEEVSINAFSNIIEGLTIAVFYDDVLVLGERPLVSQFKSIIQSIALLCGSEFPNTKCDDLRDLSSPARHLGALWRVDRDSHLLIQCVKPEPIVLSEPVASRRLAFAHAGRYFDGLRCHADVRLISDYLRHVFGQSPGGSRKAAWDKRWRLSPSQFSSYKSLIRQMEESSLGRCTHTAIPADHETLLVHCDASTSGYGYLLHSVGESSPESCADLTTPSKVLLQAVAGSFAFRPSEHRWHINRKEAVVLHRALSALERWLSLFSPHSRQVKKAVVYCDNKSAVSWATQLIVGTKSYDRIALQRLVDSISTIVSHIREVYDVELTFQYIEGSRNSEADRLSRLSSTLPSLNIGKTGGRDALDPVLEKTTKPSCPAHVNMMMVTSCAQDVFTVGPHLWSSHRCLHPIDVAEATDCRPVPTVSLAVCDDQTKSESSAFVDLTTVGNMTEADIVRHMASACDCPEYAENVEVVRGITVYDIL
ncbi:hypothetical protein FOZ63_028838, partial [Perkinsus olseni]